MAIAIEDRIRRAFDLARSHGPTWVSPRVLALLSEHGEPAEPGEPTSAGAITSAAPDTARAAVVLGTRASACGHAVADASPPRGVPTYLVLEDEGTLASRLAPDAARTEGGGVNGPGADVEGVVSILCRRGRIDLCGGAFVVLEVEDGVSARETQAEYAVPMSADARLTAFE